MDELMKRRYKKFNYIKEKFGMDQKTLYRYGEEELIRYIRKSKSNIRYYDTRDIIRYFNDKSIPGTEEENFCYARITNEEDEKS
jgi:hypothetical protein